MAMSRTRLLCNSCATGADLGFKTKERAQSFVFQFTCFIVMGLSSFLSSEKRLLSRAQIRIKQARFREAASFSLEEFRMEARTNPAACYSFVANSTLIIRVKSRSMEKPLTDAPLGTHSR